ncbi:hypothetical protein FA13DRAFT_1727322 [Coprinellus micaceus]|uniref:Uncharacterized protein n=1 Tax=Coprinellus micaceus TaxID=71717 RepID=A0A4Y7TS23_COPMI|nr:hypothetical protein FA13DRAFT_1727322 [Coprinellus micaceus]
MRVGSLEPGSTKTAFDVILGAKISVEANGWVPRSRPSRRQRSSRWAIIGATTALRFEARLTLRRPSGSDSEQNV